MRLLHLADLHIGKVVNDYSMIDEQRFVFDQILDYIKKYSVEAVMIAGDVYDQQFPRLDAVKLFDDFLFDLTRQDVDVLIIAGNHDSSDRLKFGSRILAKNKVYIFGGYNGKLECVTLRDVYGEIKFYCLPFVKPSLVKHVLSSQRQAQESKDSMNAINIDSYSDAINAILSIERIDVSARNVLIAHQFFTSVSDTANLSDSEELSIGGLDEINAACLDKFDYVALGHLHGCQRVGSDKIMYAGTPLKYSFSEMNHKKCALLVDIGGKCDVKEVDKSGLVKDCETCFTSNLTIGKLPLQPIHDMREVRGEFDEIMKGNDEKNSRSADYVRVVLTDDEEIIDPMNKLRQIYPNIMNLVFEKTHTSIDIFSVKHEREEENLSEFELFSQFYSECTHEILTDEQVKIIDGMLEQMTDERF